MDQRNATDYWISDTIPKELPLSIRITVGFFVITVLITGVLGNSMVAIVIGCSSHMRTSTNFYLVNLSVADLLVLLIITPTALLEIIFQPDIWMLGSFFCYLIPVLELTVWNVSVLTILAISFERYYIICSPLQARRVCTKSRTLYICITIWILAAVITSPVYSFTNYYVFANEQTGAIEPKCLVSAGLFWPDVYVIFSFLMFYLIPLFILTVTFVIIAKRLTLTNLALNAQNEDKQRRHVVLMLGAVVFTFFFFLFPFRILTLAVVMTDFDSESDAFYVILYFTRIMAYVNSALNPILYNIMSSKFRNGFHRLCSRKY